ncbi:MAG: hypothetical protein II631_03430, partial [Treponema sp.]|nr:hypothetical protein [Treponema sp.]
MVKLCPALRDRSNSAAFYPLKQVAPRTARRLLAEETGKFSPENLRDKMPRRWFIPLSRVPLSLQPPHFVAVAGYAALPIGARLYLYSPATKRPFLTNLCLHIQKANISL